VILCPVCGSVPGRPRWSGGRTSCRCGELQIDPGQPVGAYFGRYPNRALLFAAGLLMELHGNPLSPTGNHTTIPDEDDLMEIVGWYAAREVMGS